MARPTLPADQRKKPRGIGLTDRQNETLQMLGGSAYMQKHLDKKRADMERGTVTLTFVKTSKKASSA